jgi:predicted tellurium resistance membrane protein TerC
MVVVFELSSIASIGSAVALTIFALVTCAHLQVYRETGAQPAVLALGLLVILITLVTFALTTLVEEPETIVTIAGILVVSIGLDLWWSWSRNKSAASPAAT